MGGGDGGGGSGRSGPDHRAPGGARAAGPGQVRGRSGARSGGRRRQARGPAGRGAVREGQGPRRAGVHRALLVARAARGSFGAARAAAAGLRLRLHQALAAAAHAARGQGCRPGHRSDREPGRPRQTAGPDPCAEGRRTLFRCRGGGRPRPRDRRAQRLDPALPGDGPGHHDHQHRCRAASRDLSRQGGAAGRDAALHA